MSKIVGIVGTTFCGSTLLSFILGSHSEIFATSEVATLFHQKENTKCSICGKDCKFWTSTFVSALYHNIKDRYFWIAEKAQNDLNKSIIVISDKNPCVYIASPIKCDTYITLFKRPEAFTNSYLVHNNTNKIQTPLNIYIDTYNKAFELSNNHYIFYEDFAKHPEKITKFICKILDVKYSRAMLRFWEHEHHTLGGNSGVHLHVWDKTKMENTLNSSYWNEVYSKEHTSYVKQYYRQIKVDEKWKEQLINEQKIKIATNQPSKLIFEKLLNYRSY